MQNFKSKQGKPWEYEGEMVMQAPKNPYSPSSGKSKMLSGSGYASSSGPYQAQVGDPYGDRFDTGDTNARFEQKIEEIIADINNGRMDGKIGEQMIFRLKEDQQKAKGDYVRNAYEMRPQNPAMAQRQAPRPYDARTGQSMGDTQLNQVYRNDAAMYRRMGGATDPRTIAQNPYLMNAQDKAFYDYNQAIKNAQSRF